MSRRVICPRNFVHRVKFNGGNIWCLDCDEPAAVLTDPDEWEYEEGDPSVGIWEGWTHVECPNYEDGKGTELIRRPGIREPEGVRCLDCGAILDFPEPDYESMVRS